MPILKPLAAGAVLYAVASGVAASSTLTRHEFIQLELRPRVCTLSARDQQCTAEVHAQWRSSRDESLCLLIVGRPQIKRCWEGYSEGVYSLRLAFSEDLVVELRDRELRTVLASEVITVIKEALRLRRKRRQPWSPF